MTNIQELLCTALISSRASDHITATYGGYEWSKSFFLFEIILLSSNIDLLCLTEGLSGCKDIPPSGGQGFKPC